MSNKSDIYYNKNIIKKLILFCTLSCKDETMGMLHPLPSEQIKSVGKERVHE